MHITQLLERAFFTDKSPNGKYSKIDQDYFSDNEDKFINSFIDSPFSHIGQQNVIKDLQPFHLLLYLPNNKIINNETNEFLKYNTSIK